MAGRDIIVMGGSSGGIEALQQIVSGLPEYLPAAVFVVIHFPEGAPSMLPRILERAGPLPASHPEDGEEIRTGHIYVAPPDFHLLVEPGRVRLTRGPRENLHRPAVDALFRSAAVAYGPRVIGVVLTGARNDGTAGLVAVKRRGGVAVVQDPETAMFSSMPGSALDYVKADHVVPLEKMASLLSRLARETRREFSEVRPVPEDMEMEVGVARGDGGSPENVRKFGTPSPFSCPECHGPLWEIREGDLARFRCRVGHAFTPESVLAEQSGAVEEALYIALNTLQENKTMSERLAASARGRGQQHAAARFEKRAREAQQKADVIRRVLSEGIPGAAEIL